MATPQRQRQSGQHEAILQAIGRVAQTLLQATGSEIDTAVHQTLAELGRSAGVCRSYIFANTASAGGTLSARRAYSWNASHAPPFRPSEEEMRVGYEGGGFESWRRRLARGEAIHGPVSTFPPAERQMLEAAGVLSLAVVPIFVDEGWWGFVGFSDLRQPRRWQESELDALRVGAGIIGAAFQRRQVEETLRQRNRELALLNRVVAATTSTTEPLEVLKTVCRELARAFAVPQVGAALLNPAGTALELVVQYSELDGPGDVGATIPLAGNEATQFVLEKKQPLVITDAHHDERPDAAPEQKGNRNLVSILLLPLVVGDEAVGTIGLDAPATRSFDEADVTLAASAAAAAAQMLEKARLRRVEQRNASRLSGILHLSTELATVRDEATLLQKLVSGLASVAGSTTCTIFFVEPAEAQATLVAQVGLPPGSEGYRVPLSHPALVEVFERREPLVVGDIDREYPALRQVLVRDDVRAFYLYPLISEGDSLGFITLGYLHPYDASQTEVNAYRLLAERAAAAIHTVRLLQAVRQQADHLGALNELGLAISSTLEPEEVYGAIVEHAARLVGADVAHLYLLEEEQGTYLGLATHGAGADGVRGERHPQEESKLLPALREGPGVLTIEDAGSSPLLDDAWRRRFRAGAALVVSLYYWERLTGFLVCIQAHHRRTWTPEEVTLAESLAGQAAIAVANARLHAATRRLLRQTSAQARTVRRIVDTVPEGILLLDGNRRVVMANPLAREYLPVLADYGPDRVLRGLGGRSLDSLLEEPPPGALAHELVVGRPHHRIFELSAHPLASRPQSRNLLLVIHEATAEREQQAYLHAQDRLATVGQLAAGIAHDFNNIMAVIALYSQTLLQRDLADADRESMAIIYEQAHQASHLISQILDFSRRSVVERRPLNLIPFMKELVKLLGRTLPETIAVQLDHGDEGYVVSADLTRLQQALINLALNARDAMPGGGALRFSLSRYDSSWQPALPDMSPGDWICLTATDDGKGIRREQLPHIFEPFYTTKEPGEGVGLGLAQVYGIVKQHEGFVAVESVPGRGTTVTIYLPALPDRPDAEDPAPARDPVTASGERILLVEDDESMREALAQTLVDLNYQVLVAANGEEALALYDSEAGNVMLVLSDIVMPRMGGQALSTALQERRPDLPVVLFSGYPLGDETRAFVEAQGVRWLQKPFTRRQVHEAIQIALGAARGNQRS